MTVCTIPWCVALAETDGTSCAVHRQFPRLRQLEPGLPLDTAGDPECDACEGAGRCELCNGEGTHACECGDDHNCRACRGDGHCARCRLAGDKDPWRRRYLVFAFDAGCQPVRVEQPWEEMP